MLKRTLGVLGSLFGLIIFSPILIAIAILIRAKMGAPVLFRQTRPGRDGKPFRMIKFRTMLDAVGSDGTPLPDDQRLTGLGRFLRATSMDELPELWNVLKGDMSLVGPRPLLMEYLPLYSQEQSRRHEVRPGITGWAQVNGRNAISWDEKFALDIWYVDNRSIWLDIKILWSTVKKVIAVEGITADGEATMSKFKGKNDPAANNRCRWSWQSSCRNSRGLWLL
ncbi:MAG: sugar transferase [Rhizobiaceae bacterium]|nr:sugar transferase [Rhizobiaceae bacterium]